MFAYHRIQIISKSAWLAMASDTKDSAQYFSHPFVRDPSRDPVDRPIQGHDAMQPQELREPADIITRPLLSALNSSWGPG